MDLKDAFDVWNDTERIPEKLDLPTWSGFAKDGVPGQFLLFLACAWHEREAE
jgi:hypothetical protein